MNKDLFLAILSMDSYNRGYGEGIKDLGGVGSKIGKATITQQSDVRIGDPGVNAGFYALAYDMTGVSGFADGERVIAYRGSDQIPGKGTIILDWLFGRATTSDAANGFGVATGSPDGPQALLALEFYRAVTGNDAGEGKTTLTGHSLGGGLAGLVGSIFGEASVLYDPMPYRNAVAKAQRISAETAVLSSQAETRQRFLNAIGGVDLLPYSVATTSAYYIPTQTVNLSSGSNLLDSWRQSNLNVFDSYIANDVNALSDPFGMQNNVPLKVTDNNGVGQAHANTLIVVNMFGNLLDNDDWKVAAKYFIPAFFDQDVGKAAGAEAIDNTENQYAGNEGKHDYAGAMQNAIAYSAISEGERPFGDTAIWSMFNDAGDLGRALNGAQAGAGVSQVIRDAAAGLGQMLVQYAGKLALGDMEQDELTVNVKDGILKFGGGLLSVDMSDKRWAYGAGHNKIMGQEALVAAVLKLLPSSVTGITADEVERVVLATNNQGGDIDISSAEASKTTVTVGAGGADNVRGTSAKDVMIGGGGTGDVLDGGAGNDILYAEGGTRATTIGGLGKDWIYNTSAGGVIWGDVENSFRQTDGTRGYVTSQVNARGETVTVVKTVADTAANADTFRFAPGVTIMDAQKNDRLKFYGITLTGGDTTASSVVSFAMPGIAAAAGLYNLGRAAADLPLIYFDRFVPWIKYKLEDGAAAETKRVVANDNEQGGWLGWEKAA